MKYVLIITLALLISSCTKDEPKQDPFKSIACNIGKTIGLGVSAGIAQELQCKNQIAIQNTLVLALEKAKICETPKSSTLFGLASTEATGGNALCNSIGNMLLSGVVFGVIPPSWECSPDASMEKLKTVVAKACGKIK